MSPPISENQKSLHPSKEWAIIIALSLSLFLPDISHAATQIHGAKAAGMGTAFVAIADDLSAMVYNPAGLTLSKGTNVYTGATAVMFSSDYKSPLGGSEDTEFQVFFPPHLYISSDFDMENKVLGLAIFSVFGIGGRKWDQSGLTRYADTESMITTLAINPTFAWEIKRTIHRANVPHIQIQTLGGFGVLRDDSPIQDKKWQGNQPKLLLKAIIAHGSGSVSKEIIIEDLWPEGRPEAVEKNFKVTLHRLRKALEPKTEKTLGSAYIHLKDKFICLDKELCHVDVDEFLSLYEKGKNKEKEGDAKKALSLYEQAVELYKGDFLVEDLYAPWADIKREELRIKHIELLYKIAQLYESRGASNKATACYKKVVQSDPLSEKAYQRLMALYSNRGMRSAALKVYEECKKALLTGLDTEPDEITTSIYKKVLEM